MILHKTPIFIQKLFPSLIWTGDKNPKKIYLTFDDGPIPDLTEYILDVLRDFHIKATFFCVGENLVKNKSIAERAIDEGHQLANHTFNHQNGWKVDSKEYLHNIELCQEQLEKLGQKNRFFRPPYGKIKYGQLKKIEARHTIVMWDVLTGDYSNSISPEVCLNKSIDATNTGSIVVFHDNIKAQQNVSYTLPRYIEHFLNKDYQFALL